ncbi:hypothetical protein BLNAU_8492 [Blattamonas nauphoetae]|uniref:Uncharacterized protein n=1 Tax=Blattamonas nauphoetae TaxID=2049346 RepID=A0ABQ9XYU6_9EUKA|nr:hypothetical protein BLNAU_8492 [Blattamonas nauphoetae]
MLSPPLQTQCLPINSNTVPSKQFPPRKVRISSTKSSPLATPSHKEVTNKAALPLADLVTGNVGNRNQRIQRHSILTSGGGQQSYNILSGYVADGGISTDHSGERAPDSSWGMVRVGNSRNQANHTRKAAAMDNEEDKEEEQSEILAEDDIEGEQSEEEPSPAPTNHRALASRRNTSSPTKHPPQPQTLPQLPISPLSTPVALSPILAFATTPAQHRVINKTMT